MKLHENQKDFIDLIELTAQHFGMRPLFVEKDYWVTNVLKNLANSQYTNNVVFKGGTSLSKAHGYIERFSEDIDLALLSPNSYSDAKRKKLLKDITTAISKDITLIDGHEKEVKMGKNRTTAYKYPRALTDTNFGAVKDYILLEINCFTNPAPYKKLPIQTYIAQFLVEGKHNNEIDEFELDTFNVNVLAAERTYFEKVLSLNRLSYTGVSSLKEKVRHFNDIIRIQTNKNLQEAILTPNSFDLINAVRKDDENNPTMRGPWLESA
jgi:hypothetical protein